MGEREVRDALRGPVTERVGALLGRPADEREELPALARADARTRTATRVAVQQPRRVRETTPIDRRQRRHHGRNRHGERIDVAECRERTPRTPAPRAFSIVLEPVGFRHPEPMRDPGAGDDRAVGVGGNRLHRCRADVDPNGDFAHDEPQLCGVSAVSAYVPFSV